ncbi:ATP-binding protein [Methylobacterium sp. V23]|uniref:ATP-binding protein n=1 Tax=Methylobacterium sp. V23 TaxID=2044878 RepID=UPI0011AFD8B6|nr:ATP-binding protein [Methylobacterium sp. V23]
MSDPGTAILLLDADGTRILHASPRAESLRDGIGGADGRVDAALRLGEQIGRAPLRTNQPLLMRLHLDARRLAPPVLFSVMRVALTESHDAVVLVANTPLPIRLPPRRPRSEHDASAVDSDPSVAPDAPDDVNAPVAQDAVAQEPVSHESVVETEVPIVARQRFTWESDATGTILQVSSAAGPALRRRLEGRSWQALADADVLRDAGGLLAALDLGRTFRAIPLTLLAADGGLCDLDVSGAPKNRAGSGFRGFGQIRSIMAPVATSSVPEIEPAPASPTPAEVAAPHPHAASHAEAEVTADAPVEAVAGAPDEAAVESAVESSDPHLSSHEHAAFREIARALGARFAGDERSDKEAEPSLPCAVMPFPVPFVRSSEEPLPDGAMVATLERIPAGVLVYRDDTVLFANQPLLRLVGYATREELTAAGGIVHLFGGLDPQDRPAGEAPLVLATRGGGRVSVLIEQSALEWAGRPAQLLLARDAEPSEDARAAKATAIAQDFAARHSLDARAVLDALEDGIVLLDHQARILSLNRRTAETFGLEPREVVGASFLGLFASEHAVDLLARLHAEPGAPVRDEMPVAARGTGRRLRVKLLPLSGDAEERVCAVIRDTPAMPDRVGADLRHAADLSTAPAERDTISQQAELLTQVGQAIQAPLKAMLDSLDGLIDRTGHSTGSQHDRASLQGVHDSGTRLLDLVTDLLDLARIESGKVDRVIADMSLNDVVSRCVALLHPEAVRRRIVLRTSFSTDLPVLSADERFVRQATLNVIANAIALTEAGGQVIVSTSLADRGEIALRIRDTGVGMSAAEMEGALHPFRSGLPVEPSRGTGLGLPLTKALTEANHGRFHISSRKDEGTLVEMLFPVPGATKRA